MTLQDLKFRLAAFDRQYIADRPMLLECVRLAELLTDMFEKDWQGVITLSKKGWEVMGDEYDVADAVPLAAAYLFGEE